MHWPKCKVMTVKKYFSGLLILVGNSLTTIGCVGLLLTLSGLIQAEIFAREVARLFKTESVAF